ncbi:hypothetical protein TNCV_4488321 [Trichonephila clavipes]|nr:hypothetical protein TNCV_4488321 [Trichonephila clavipes]
MSADENKTPENRRKLAGVCLQSRKACQLSFLRLSNYYARNNLFKVFYGRTERWKNPESSRVASDAPCESPWIKEIMKLREEMQTIEAGVSNQKKRNFKCWGCSGPGHLRRNCPQQGRMRTSSLLPNRKTSMWLSHGAEVVI